jgi:hypothetical protein
VLSDAEADPDYDFDGLARLIEVVRADFGAEVEFLDGAELSAILDGDLRRHFGTRDQLRRGQWSEEATPDPPLAGGRRSAIQPARDRMALAHLGLAWIRYRDDDGRLSNLPQSMLLYVKPTLSGDEPLDVLHYHADHPDFPQETTTDQYFDEAQWESYRKLGEHIGEQLMAPVKSALLSNTPYKWLVSGVANLPETLYCVTRLSRLSGMTASLPLQWSAGRLASTDDWRVFRIDVDPQHFIILENLTDRELTYDFHSGWQSEFERSILVDRRQESRGHVMPDVGAVLGPNVLAPPHSVFFLRGR